MFNLVWGTIIGLAIGASGKLLMEKEECGSLSGITGGRSWGFCGYGMFNRTLGFFLRHHRLLFWSLLFSGDLCINQEST